MLAASCLLIGGLAPAGFGADTTPANVRDVREWRENGLPIAAEWNVKNYTVDYHADQLRKGHWFLPSVELPPVTAPNGKDSTRPVGGSMESWEYLRKTGAPLCLRTNNIADAFIGPRHRVPIALENIPKSPLVWHIVDGRLDDRKLIDCFGPVEVWRKEGELWGRYRQMDRIQQLHPNPAYVIFLENNEGSREHLQRYTRRSKDEKSRSWRSLEELERESLRMRDRVAELTRADPKARPEDFHPEYWAKRRAQYQALYAGFESSLTEAWRGKTLTAAYKAMREARDATPSRFVDELGYAPELTYYDAGSEPVYSMQGRLVDFTSPDHLTVLNLIPAWEAARKRNPRAYREFSLHISAGGVAAGAIAGRHEVITPTRYEGFVQWLLWSIHEPGVPVLLRRWCSAAEKPDTPLFSEEQKRRLSEFGEPDLRSAVSSTYLEPIVSAVDRICSHPTLREFWLQGRTVVVPGLGHPSKQLNEDLPPYPTSGAADNRWRLLECSANPPRETWIVRGKRPGDNDAPVYAPDLAIRVWAVAVRKGDQTLLFAWSPCRSSGKISVTIPGTGDVDIDFPQPWKYWIIGPGGRAESLAFTRNESLR